MYREKKKLMEGKLDQALLQEKLKEWSLHMEQTMWHASAQKQMKATETPSCWSSRQTGNIISLRNMARNWWYLTTRYTLPLFFLCVYTNSGYNIVILATIIIDNENVDSLLEAFDRLKDVNSGFSPTAFMIDMSELKVNATKMSFPGKTIIFYIYRNNIIFSCTDSFSCWYLFASNIISGFWTRT